MKINILKSQKEIILKAIDNLKSLYDFENTSETEFKDTYGYSKINLIKHANRLKEEILK